MKVACYIHAVRSWQNVSGVGRHLNELILQLAKRAEATVVCCNEGLGADGKLPETSPLRHLPLQVIPRRRRMVEVPWELLNWPKFDRWAAGFDWVYSPAEVPLPSAGRHGAKTAVTLHDAVAFEAPLWPLDARGKKSAARMRSLARTITRRADRVITVSEFSKRRFVEELGTAPERISVVGNGVSEFYFDIRTAPAAERHEDPYVLVVGGMHHRKNSGTVLEVARLLAEGDRPIRLKVAGICYPPFDGLAKGAPGVELLGYVKDADVAPMFSRATALLFPSLYEGFGMPAVEAMAARVPVVTSNAAALPEVVGDAGLAFDPRDAKAMAAAIRRLSEDDGWREQWVVKGQQRAERFTWDQCGRRLAEALGNG